MLVGETVGAIVVGGTVVGGGVVGEAVVGLGESVRLDGVGATDGAGETVEELECDGAGVMVGAGEVVGAGDDVEFPGGVGERDGAGDTVGAVVFVPEWFAVFPTTYVFHGDKILGTEGG
jgi:hypothetical protein